MSLSDSVSNKLGEGNSPPSDDQDHHDFKREKSDSLNSFHGDPVPTGEVRPVEVISFLALIQLMLGIIYVMITGIGLVMPNPEKSKIPTRNILFIHLYEGIVMILSASLNKFAEDIANKFCFGLRIMTFNMRAFSLVGVTGLLIWNSIELAYPAKDEVPAVITMWIFETMMYTSLLYYTARVMKSNWYEAKKEPSHPDLHGGHWN
ncbi:hypothetical protein HDE_06471 [Halotydeus destructor]|nr:hypothetical protein HDE_06471 [Halotydeus destructor]